MDRRIFYLNMEDGTVPDTYIIPDASPQCKGHELFGAVLQTFTPNSNPPVTVRRFPYMNLSFGHLGLADKLARLLWMIFLCVGPHLSAVRVFLGRVRIILSDWGTEHLIVNCLNTLRIFFSYIFPALGNFFFNFGSD